ncbi:MAG: glycosyltransferase family 9 protein [Elusimicrobia bacterium]|nr:glycosyltransferase family 9 protein [Elusimicrobiota bacterium]
MLGPDAAVSGPAKQVQNVAALWIGRVGDLIVSTPLLRSLRRAFPDARILLVTSEPCADTAGLIPFVDEVAVLRGFYRPMAAARLAAALLGRSWDLLVDLNPSFSKTSAALAALARARVRLSFKKGRLDRAFTRQVEAPGLAEHMLDRYRRLAAAFGGEFDERTELSLTSAHEKAAGWLLIEAGILPDKLNVLIHPGNFKKFDHRWPQEKFAALTDLLLKEQDVRLVYLAGPGEEARVRGILAGLSVAVPLIGPASIGVTAAVLRPFDLCVVNATGTMHLAAAVGTPTFGFYSGYADKVWRPRGPRHIGLVSRSWTSCRDITVEEAYAALRSEFARRLPAEGRSPPGLDE